MSMETLRDAYKDSPNEQERKAVTSDDRQPTEDLNPVMSRIHRVICRGHSSRLSGEKSPLQCAGINRHEAGNERVLRVGSSDPLGLESCGGHREVHTEA